MSNRPRPSGAGQGASASTFLRPTLLPRAALVFTASLAPPTDWAIVEEFDACDSPLNHALGWVCELRQKEIVLLNPLGEGVLKADLPAPLTEAWLSEARASHSSAIYLLDGPVGDDSAAAVNAAARRGGIPAATVRTGFAADFGKTASVGRNAPCPCGSGRKFKTCHGR